MKRIQLTKAAIDFAYANYTEAQISLAQKSLAAFVAAGGKDADLQIWNNIVTQNVAQANQISKQKLPSESLPAEAPDAPISNAGAVAAQATEQDPKAA